jgi:drug/metabolite transporter (DMT)-like permease
VAGLQAKANEDKAMVGIVMMLFAYAAFSCIDTSAKWLALLGLPALQVSFMRYIGHFVVSASLIARGGISRSRFGSDKPLLVILRGFLLMGSTILNFIAVRYLSLTLTSTIMFSAPIIICALSGPLLGERVGIWRWMAIVVGFVGIVIAVRPFNADFHWAVLLSLAGTFCFALYALLTRKLSGIIASDTMQFYSGLVGAVVLAPFAIVTWRNPPEIFDWMLLFGLGFFGWLGHEVLTRAHGYATAATLTPFGYAFIVYLTIWSYFVFDQLPDVWTIAGAAVIVASGLFIWYRERLLSRQRMLSASRKLT